MSNLVIVAIPDENDRVWKISSEKKPHLTLLFLGDADEVSNSQQIVEFVEHAANTTMRRFYLPVDRRGELGADQADVLFFKKGRYDYKAVRDFRAVLLKDDNIKTAYDSATQFEGPWQPHLTLGYPASPAKPDDTDRDFGFYDVAFNKIGVWFGDYEGPEFLLKDYWDEYEALETVPMDVAMSDVHDAIEHYGVKGMKWGVRKAGKLVVGTAKIADNVLFEINAQQPKTAQDIALRAHKAMKKQDLPAIKAKHGAAGKKLNRIKRPLSSEAKAYRKDVKAAYLKQLETSANATTNFQGNRRYTLKENGQPNTAKYRWKVSTEKVPKTAQHADEMLEDFEFVIRPVFDNDGWIVDFEMPGVDGGDSMAQTADLGEAFLIHYGVKGMRWGHRKAPTAVAPRATSVVPSGARRKTKVKVEGGENHDAAPDAIKVAQAKAKLKKSGVATLSNAELKEVANRLQLEKQVKELTQPSGKKFVSNLLRNQGNQQANRVIDREVRKLF